MTVALGDIVVPAAIFPYVTTVPSPGTALQNLANGLVVDKPIFGRVADITAAPEIRVDWNTTAPSALGINAFTTTDTYATHNDSLRFVEPAAAATVTAFLGRYVQLQSPASQEAAGVVVSVFSLEAESVGKAADDPVMTEVVLFRTRSGQYFLAATTTVAVVPGQ